jgi:hypothetical protein
MGADGYVLEARATRAANGRDWFVFREGEWLLAVWRDDLGGRIHVGPCTRAGDLPGELLGLAHLDEGIVGALPIALPVDPVLERIAIRLWSPDLTRHELPQGPWEEAALAGLSAELAGAVEDALAMPSLVERLRNIGRELDGGPGSG